ncbi:MAG: IS256 family transposase [Eubacteriales bacterium]|jgi:putative transposase
MNDFTTKVLEGIEAGVSFDEVIRKTVEQTVNTLMEAERTAFLGYEPHNVAGHHCGNSRNGYYPRSEKTKYGGLDLDIPRVRKGKFAPRTPVLFKEQDNQLEDFIILLYQKGVSTREIGDIIEKMYGHHYSPQAVSNITEVMVDELQAFSERTVKDRYVVLYCDATFINVRRDTVAKEALHVILGIDEEGHKEVLSFAVYPTEAASNYQEMLVDLQDRGLKEVLLFVSDELTGLGNAVTDIFPKAKHQTCWTHLIRNLLNKVRASDKAAVADDLKTIYQQTDVTIAIQNLQAFVEKWGKKYPKMTSSLQSKKNLFSFMSFPKSIQSSLYTNNISENFNKQLKRLTKSKEQFPNEVALEKLAYCYVVEYNAKGASRTHKGFNMAQFEIAEMFEQLSFSDRTVEKPTDTDNVAHTLEQVS